MTGLDTRPSEVLEIPEPTALPFAAALGIALFFFGLLIDATVVGVIGVAFAAVAVLRWLWHTDMDHT